MYNTVFGKFTGKERDAETGLYYYGARYLDGKTSRWLSADPALGDYVPGAPVDDEARKRNGNLPGMGGVFNTVNFHLYHYAGNNPVKYIDPDGKINLPVLATYLKNSEGSPWENTKISGDPSGIKIGIGGCAITGVANVTATFPFIQTRDPGQINQTGGVLNDKGDVVWSSLGGSLSSSAQNIQASKHSGQFTHATYQDQGNDFSKQYAALVKVQYDSANNPHWVGVEGIDSVGGTDYIVISPTSIHDNASSGSTRAAQGWIQRTDGKILVPVNKTHEYVTFSTTNSL